MLPAMLGGDGPSVVVAGKSYTPSVQEAEQFNVMLGHLRSSKSTFSFP
jgi:hypothetical protein